MVPLMMEEGYRPNGWLGMMLGVRLYYVFFGSILCTQTAFDAKVDELCHGLGHAGRSTPLVSNPAPGLQPTPLAAGATVTTEVSTGGDSRAQQRSTPSAEWLSESPSIADTPPSTTPTLPASVSQQSSHNDTVGGHVMNSSLPLSEGFYVMQLELQRAAAEREREKSKSDDRLHSTLTMGLTLAALGVGFGLGCAFGVAVTLRMTTTVAHVAMQPRK